VDPDLVGTELSQDPDQDKFPGADSSTQLAEPLVTSEGALTVFVFVANTTHPYQCILNERPVPVYSKCKLLRSCRTLHLSFLAF
jgi:hypothetical protein